MGGICGGFRVCPGNSFPLPPEQMIAPEDKSVLDSQAKEIFREWDKVAVPVGQSVVALVAGNAQVALGTVVGKGKSSPS